MHGTDINIHADPFSAPLACMLPGFSSSGVMNPSCIAMTLW